MCLAVPAQVLSVDGSKAQVDIQGNRREVDVTLVNVQPGDWVLIHAGIAIQVLDKEQAEATVAAYRELREALGI
ncbi:MAG TPA: HypC/HybG/HupF family hydrogenase formation chaperone [Symbiobacteriaceae bacterium]